jgi:hypothetical protein
MAIVELSFQSFRLCDTARYLQAVEQGVAWPDADAPRLGAWITTVGELNRGMLLYEKGTVSRAVSERESMLAAIPLVKQKRHLLQPVRNYSAQDSSMRVYELRIYTLYPGKVDQFLDLLLAILPLRERYSPNVCVWRSLSGDPDRVFHLWAYETFEQRVRSRSAINADPAWRDYIATVSPLIAKIKSCFLEPLRIESASV